MASEAPLNVEAVVTPVKEVTKADAEVVKECKEKQAQTNGTKNGSGDAPVANGNGEAKNEEVTDVPKDDKEKLNESETEKEATKRPAEDKTEESKNDDTKKAKLDEKVEEAVKSTEDKEEKTAE